MNQTNQQFRNVRRILAGIALVVGGFLASTSQAQGPSLAMLDRFEGGLWDVRLRDDGSHRQLCIESGRSLIQIRHPGESCRSFVVEDGPGAVTVQYTCPASGYGRTRIRFENARLAQLETQGIADGLPFDFGAEARRVGSCTR